LVTEVSLRDSWNQQRNRPNAFSTYNWMTKNSIPDRLDTTQVVEWKHEIHNMLCCISKPRVWVSHKLYCFGTLTSHFRSIESKIASYKVLNGSVPSLDVAIMTHIFSYIRAASSDSNHGGGGGGELENESDDTSSAAFSDSNHGRGRGGELENESDEYGDH